MEEKRKFPRLNTAEIIVIWRKAETFDNLHRMKNISGGGICLMIDRKEVVNVGDTLQLEFRLPTGEIIYSKARVARSGKLTEEANSGQEIGIEFLDISDKDRKTIEQFVSPRLSSDKGTASA
jgi:c-di-GMP-binding flagellar brake protein YcgR